MDIDPLGSWHNPEFKKETGGFLPRVYSNNNHIIREFCDLDSHDNVRKDMITLLLRTIIENDTFGDFGELGVYKGHTAHSSPLSHRSSSPDIGWACNQPVQIQT